MIVDEHGDTIYFNEPAEAILGTPFDELETMTPEERTRFMAPRDAGGHKLAPQELPAMVAMRERRPTHAVFEIAGMDGIRRPVESTGIPLEGAGGHMIGALVIIWRTSAMPRRGTPSRPRPAPGDRSGDPLPRDRRPDGRPPR